MRVSFEQAVDRLLRGEVVALPTETVYGLAAPLAKVDAIAHIFELKKRPSDNPLIIHLADATDIVPFARDLPPGMEELTDAFWPGPLTLILPIDQGEVPAIARASLPTAAFRVPDSTTTRSIVRQVGPLVAPSANLSGSPSATTPEHVEHDFGADFPVLDGGACAKGVESTILIYVGDKWQIARQGALAAEDFRSVLGYAPLLVDPLRKSSAGLCPGQHYRHYAPQSTLVLGKEPYQGIPKVVLGFSDRIYPGAERVIAMGHSTDAAEVAHNLYSVLRSLDDAGVKDAWVDMQFPRTGLWSTVTERLTRAAQ